MQTKTEYCKKCEYSHKANEGHRGFVCECSCHHTAGELETAFSSMKLVDKTVCEDRVIYVFAPLV